jgi:hypothetical protein
MSEVCSYDELVSSRGIGFRSDVVAVECSLRAICGKKWGRSVAGEGDVA